MEGLKKIFWKKRRCETVFLAGMLLPVPFVWFGYGEAGVYGWAMLENGLFLLSMAALWLPRIFLEKHRAVQWIGAVGLTASYIWQAGDFMQALPLDWNIGMVFRVCRFPFVLSFCSAVLMLAGYAWNVHQKKALR